MVKSNSAGSVKAPDRLRRFSPPANSLFRRRSLTVSQTAPALMQEPIANQTSTAAHLASSSSSVLAPVSLSVLEQAASPVVTPHLPVHPLFKSTTHASTPASSRELETMSGGTIPRRQSALDAGSEGALDPAASSSSSKRASGTFESFKQRLHLRPSSSSHFTIGDDRSITAVATKKHRRSQSVNGSPSSGFARLLGGSGSRYDSGLSTPSNKSDEPSGDFANFLAVAELKQRLRDERDSALKRALERAKHPRRKLSVDQVKTSSATVTVADHAIEMLDTPPLDRSTLEEQGYFPGDLRHYDQLDGPRRHSWSIRPTSRPTSTHSAALRRNSTSSSSRRTTRASSMCGSFQDWYTEDEDASPSTEPRRSSSDDEQSSRSDASSTSSFIDRLRDRTASTISLFSYAAEEDASPYGGEVAQPLKKPLLELEELELDAFLRNFGRHTREVRVPQQQATLASTRMPKWDDFRVPTDEAIVAAREGRRVSVLSRVDRGLQRIAAVEGQVVAVPRRAKQVTPSRSNAKRSCPKSQKQGNVSSKLIRTSSSGAESGVSTASRVSWTSESKSIARIIQAASTPVKDLSIRKRSSESAERAAREEEEAQQRSMDTEDWEIIDDVALGEDASAQQDVAPGDEAHVDGVAFCIAYILALVERHAPQELDSDPDQAYRESKARSHIERLYLVAPFWEDLMFNMRRLYRWEDPTQTASAATVYFTLWHLNMLSASFFLLLIYYILQFRFFPPDASVLHERVRSRMRRGVEADRLAERLRRRSRLDILELYKRWVETYGSASQLATGDLADLHEKIKNLILWRNPDATWRTLGILFCTAFSLAFLPARWISKLFWAFAGANFFFVFPLQSHYPRYRRPLSPIWWALWGTPTDAQFAIQLIRRRHLEQQLGKRLAIVDAAEQTHDNGSQSSFSGSNMAPSVAGSIAHGSPQPLQGEQPLHPEHELCNKQTNSPPKPRKLGRFFCQHNAIPGHLHVTTRSLYFVALHSVRPERSHKSCKTPVEQVTGLIKTKSIRLVLWSSSGLQIQRAGKNSLFFSNMSNRDAAFNLILAVGSETWSKV